MTLTPRSPLPPSEPVSDEVLEDLLAGRLDPATAESLEARCAANPALARRLDSMRTLVRALGQEGFYACPAALLAAIVAEAAVSAGQVQPSWSLARRALALCAAVLLAVGALTALTGRLPSTDTALLPALAGVPVDLPAESLWAQAPTLEGPLAPFAVALAAALLVGGLWLARRWGAASASPTLENV